MPDHNAPDQNPRREGEGRQRPGTNKPLNGPYKPAWPAVVAVLALVVALVLLYLFGLDVLVPAG